MSATSLTFSPVNHLLMCSAGLDQKIMFFDSVDKKAIKEINCSAPLTSLAFHSDGYTIAAGTLYGTVLLFDLRTSMEPMQVLKGHANNPVNYIEFPKPRQTKTSAAAQRQKTETKEAQPPQKALFTLKEISPKQAENYSSSENIIPKEQPPSINANSKWKSIDDIREEARRNVELRKKYIFWLDITIEEFHRLNMIKVQLNPLLFNLSLAQLLLYNLLPVLLK